MDENVDHMIKNYLNYEYGPKTFGEIKAHLKKKGIEYKNSDKDRSGLAHALNRMIKQKIIKKITDKSHPYPRYTTYSKSTFESALDGYLMKTESIAYMFKAEGSHQSNMDIDPDLLKPKFSNGERLVRRLVTCLGVQTLYIILSSYGRPIDPNKSTSVNKSNREAWLKNALSYHDPSELSVDEEIERTLEGLDFAENQFENKRMLRKVALTKKKLLRIYPNITKNMINAENDLEDAKDDLRDMYLNSRRSSRIRD